MSNLISRTIRVDIDDYEKAKALSKKIYDTENISQYTRDALREKNKREAKK